MNREMRPHYKPPLLWGRTKKVKSIFQISLCSTLLSIIAVGLLTISIVTLRSPYLIVSGQIY